MPGKHILNPNSMKTPIVILLLTLVIQMSAQESQEHKLLEQKLLKAAQYLSGIDAAKDEKKALALYQECANQGSGKAMNALGIMYKEGLGVLASKKQAIEWFTKSGEMGYASGWYNLGMLYKDGKTTSERDFDKAFVYFSKAAKLNDKQSIYAKGYFYYKGFGTDQDYRAASHLFKIGAYAGMPNSMYFLALCFRNGYGVNQNKDSARCWLTRAYHKGYKMAGDELGSAEPENNNTAAKLLVQKIKRITPSAPDNVNQYKMLENNMPSGNITGIYNGFLIRYDWSGEHAIGGGRLKLELTYSEGKLLGKWIESDTIVMGFNALLTPHNVVFSNAQYQKKDHYYPVRPVTFSMENAKLQWIRKEDSLYLSGSVQMFSPELNEPQKPIFISLVKEVSELDKRNTVVKEDKNVINFTSEDGSPLFSKNLVTAYPNPFTNTINIDFSLKNAEVVEAQLLDADGRLVYKNNGGLMKPGKYSITLKPPHISAGNYIIKLFYGSQSHITKVIKL
jgi:hypothetical protein